MKWRTWRAKTAGSRRAALAGARGGPGAPILLLAVNVVHFVHEGGLQRRRGHDPDQRVVARAVRRQEGLRQRDGAARLARPQPVKQEKRAPERALGQVLGRDVLIQVFLEGAAALAHVAHHGFLVGNVRRRRRVERPELRTLHPSPYHTLHYYLFVRTNGEKTRNGFSILVKSGGDRWPRRCARPTARCVPYPLARSRNIRGTARPALATSCPSSCPSASCSASVGGPRAR